MTDRKPREVPFETWVERQIRIAQEAGAFDDLAGAGKPLPHRDRLPTTAEWAAEWARREGADLAAMLPLGLALPREREELVRTLPEKRSEAQVRALAEDFNTRLDQAYRRPPDGPPLALAPLDVEVMVQRWRAANPQPVAVPEPELEPPASMSRRRRRWLSWLRRAA
jgi:hypothetical protein